MIVFEGKNRDVSAMYINGHSVLAVYMHGKLIWSPKINNETILSCYYNGYWIDEYPWTDDTPWAKQEI